MKPTDEKQPDPKQKPQPDPARQVEDVPEATEYRSDWNIDEKDAGAKPAPSTKERPV